MKTVKKYLTAMLITGVITCSCPSAVFAQVTKPAAFDSSSQGGGAVMSDTAFIQRYIRDNILQIKVAQLAMEKTKRPRLKTMAREIIADDRQMLQSLLSLAGSSDIRGTTEQEVDSALKNLAAAPELSPQDSAANATTGNTVTDSLGSGSSGSGNVSGEDTGTLARTFSPRRNANYSENGETYIFNNRADFIKLGSGDADKRFDDRWISLMLGSQSGRLRDFETLLQNSKNTELKAIVMKAIPRYRMHHETLVRLNKGSHGPVSSDPASQREGPSNLNTKPKR